MNSRHFGVGKALVGRAVAQSNSNNNNNKAPNNPSFIPENNNINKPEGADKHKAGGLVGGKVAPPGSFLAGRNRAGAKGNADRGRDVRASTGQLAMEIVGTRPHRLHF